MSYEGYGVFYCSNGHRIAILDAHEYMWMEEDDDDYPLCEICNKKASYIDTVDQTNGCVCEEIADIGEDMGYHCPAHERVKSVIGHDFKRCDNCEGNGYELKKRYGSAEKVEVECLSCNSEGAVMVPRYDISVMKGD